MDDVTTTTSDTYLTRIGNLIRDARKHRGLTQNQLADLLGTSQSAVNRIEQGQQNLSLEMLARIGEALDSEFVSLGHAAPTHLRVIGPTTLLGLHRRQDVARTPASRCSARRLLNRGKTTLRNVARIEEVNRLLEVLTSSASRRGGSTTSNDLEIVPPAKLDLAGIDERGRPAYPLDHHVPRPAAAPLRQLRAAVRRRLRPRHPHRRAAHVGAAPLRPRGRRPPRASTTPSVDRGRQPRARRSCSPSAATPSPRTP